MITVFLCVLRVSALRVSKVDVESVSDLAPFVQSIASRREPVKSGDRIASSVAV